MLNLICESKTTEFRSQVCLKILKKVLFLFARLMSKFYHVEFCSPPNIIVGYFHFMFTYLKWLVYHSV